jgi:hypothetical protein
MDFVRRDMKVREKGRSLAFRIREQPKSKSTNGIAHSIVIAVTDCVTPWIVEQW